MKDYKRNISLSLIGLILFGIVAGALHLDEYSVDLGPTEHEKIAKDHHFCAVCIFHIQSDSTGTDEVAIFFPHYIKLYTIFEPVISDPLFSIQNYRAPPFLS